MPEVVVYILETPPGRFRIEEVDDRNEGGVEHCPDDVELPTETLNSIRCDLHDQEVEDPWRSQ